MLSIYTLFALLIVTTSCIAYTVSRRNLVAFPGVFPITAFNASSFYLLHLLFALGMAFGPQVLKEALTSFPFLVVYLIALWLMGEPIIRRIKVQVGPEAQPYVWTSITTCMLMNFTTLYLYY